MNPIVVRGPICSALSWLFILASLAGAGCGGGGQDAVTNANPYDTWSVGLTIVAIPDNDNPNGLKEGDASVETWTFAQQGAVVVLTVASGSTYGTASGTLTTTEGGFRFLGESSLLDSLGIHMVVTIDAVFVGPDNIEGTKRTDFYSLSGVALGIEPQFVGFESAAFTAQRGT